MVDVLNVYVWKDGRSKSANALATPRLELVEGSKSANAQATPRLDPVRETAD